MKKDTWNLTEHILNIGGLFMMTHTLIKLGMSTGDTLIFTIGLIFTEASLYMRTLED